MSCDQLPILYQNRHCYQEDVDEIIFKNNGFSYYKGLEGLSFFKMEKISSSKITYIKLKLGSNIYAVKEVRIGDHLKFRGLFPNNFHDALNVLPAKRYGFCVCILMKELFVFGGHYFRGTISSCFRYNFRLNKWSYKANMNESRIEAACTVFEGKIVVSGGRKNTCYLKSVELYDYHENKWTYLPDMIEHRCEHFPKCDEV